MVGDDYQLAPLLEFDQADVKNLPSYNEDKFDRLKKIYEESVFAKTLKKAEAAGRLVTLSVNYRSVKDVLRAYNIFYDNSLENQRENVQPSKVLFDKTFPVLNEKDIFFVDVQYGKEAKDGFSRYNVEEIEATASILKDLIRHTENASTVSVAAIFPYAAQINRFQKANKDLINEAKQMFESFEIDTVDAFQGKEADIVLVNTVVTDPSQRNFLNDFRRINVSMSRARDKLFVFGNPTTLSQIKMKISGGSDRTYFAEIIADIRRYGARLEYKGGMSYEAASKAKISIV
jgi:superfamily I DNA and/or RNA helicase